MWMPLVAGAGAVWLFVQWRERRDLAARAAATPDATATGWSAPSASGSVGGSLGDYDSAPMVQFPGTFDEYSSETVQVTGPLPATQEVFAPQTLYPESLVKAEPYEYRDVVSAQPVARVDDGATMRIQPVTWPKPVPSARVEVPRLQPDHRALPRREAEIVKPVHRRDPQPAPRPKPQPKSQPKAQPKSQPKSQPKAKFKSGAGVSTLAQWRAKYR